ncbi:MAG: AAA family ATPase, partial [Oscillospiraceae bacterium]|nr:AAA family ATPase [Oscillospiraceae bacterium]
MNDNKLIEQQKKNFREWLSKQHKKNSTEVYDERTIDNLISFAKNTSQFAGKNIFEIFSIEEFNDNLKILKENEAYREAASKQNYWKRSLNRYSEFLQSNTEKNKTDINPILTGEIKMNDNKLIEQSQEENFREMNKNTILYGAPGTGKTYSSVLYAVAIIEEKKVKELKKEKYEDVLKRYNELKSQGLIEFTTFHQSYGYEEFIEGIRPEIENETSGDIKYEIHDGVFKKFCQNEISQNIEIINIFKIYYDNLVEFIKQQPNEILDLKKEKTYKFTVNGNGLICHSGSRSKNSYSIDKLFKVWNGEIKNKEDDSEFYWSQALVNEMKERFSLPDFESFKSINFPFTPKNRVFIIDEINRGNISKIFGELITLIEPSKRKGHPEAMETKLPYSQTPFSVPDNVYILGTMNTADRSIALLDTALRRRFEFIEMVPDYDVLENISIDDTGINIPEMLEIINNRITALLDREHVIGHSYFLDSEFQKTPTLKCLGKIFANKIIPLLQEYFYDEYEKIRLVLGDNQKKNDEKNYMFIEIEDTSSSKLFSEEIEIGDLY